MSSTTTQSRSSTTGQTGSLVWILIWLLGTAAICWVAASKFAPRVEDRILSSIQSVLAPLTSTKSPVIASVHGRDATLTGRVIDKQQRANLLTAVKGVPGVRSVVDQLTLLETAPTPNQGDTTRNNGVSKINEDATTLTVIDSTSSESSSESADQLTDKSVSNNDNAFRTDTAARNDESTTTEIVSSEVDTDLLTDSDADAGIDVDPVDPVFEVDPEEPADELWPPEPETTETETETNIDPSSVAVNEPIDESDTLISFVETKAETESLSLLSPSLDFNIEGKTLAVSGKLSNKDDVAPLIRSAMVAFDLDYISNTIELSDDIENASWLESVSEFLPDMAGLENPSIEINEDGIHLGGTAPDTETQDTVLGAAVSLLGAYNMSEDIALTNVDTPVPLPEQSANSNGTLTSSAVSDETTEVANVKAQAEAKAKAKAKAKADADADTDADADDTSITPTEDSDAIGTAPNQADDKRIPSPSVTSSDSLRNALKDLPSMDILFESSSDVLTIDSLDVLDSIANVLIEHPGIPVRIEGHTDASGIKQDNLILSQLRANSVRDYLVDRGVSIYRLKAYGFGEGVPISDNSTPDGRADNRRIEFNIQR